MMGAMTSYSVREGWDPQLATRQDMQTKPAGTPDHKKMAIDNVLTGEALTSNGYEVALRQWFSWIDAFNAADQARHTRLLSFIMFNTTSSIYKDVSEIPLWRMEGDTATADVNGQVESDE